MTKVIQDLVSTLDDRTKTLSGRLAELRFEVQKSEHEIGEIAEARARLVSNGLPRRKMRRAAGEMVRFCDTLREAMDFAEGKLPLTFWSGFGDSYVNVTETEAAQLAEDHPDAVFIGARPRGSRPGEVVIQSRIDSEDEDTDETGWPGYFAQNDPEAYRDIDPANVPEEIDVDADSLGWLKHD